AGATEPQIRIVTDGAKRPIAVEATGGWSKDELERFAKAEREAVAELSQRLQIFVVNEKKEIQLPAMAGDYQVVGDAIRLTPRFPLRPGMAYKARFFVPARSVIAAPSAFS